MSFGLRTWDGSGNLQMDSTTFTYQVLGSWVVDFRPAGTDARSVTLTIPGFNPSTCALVLLPIDRQSQDVSGNAYAMPYVTVSSGAAVVRNSHPSDPNSFVSHIRVRAMAIRYAL